MMVSEKIRKNMETRKVQEDGLSTSIAFTNDVKFEMMLKMIENMMDKFSIDNGSFNREQNEPKIKTQTLGGKILLILCRLDKGRPKIPGTLMISKYNHLFSKIMSMVG